MVVDRLRGSFEEGTREGTRRVKRWSGRCQKRRMASNAGGEEGMNIGDMDPPKEGRAPDQRQQRLGRWSTGTLTAAGVAARQQGGNQWCQPV